MSFSYVRTDWKDTLYNLDQTHVCQHSNEAPDAKRDGGAIPTHLFRPERASSSVNFLTDSLKAAGTEDTSDREVVGGGGGFRRWRAPPSTPPLLTKR